MDIKTEALPTPVKYIVTLDENEIDERKESTYARLKPSITVNGFRKGTVPRDVAEDRIGVEKLYKSIIDNVFNEIIVTEPVVATRNFKFFGDLKQKVLFTIEFVAEVKPSVVLAPFEQIEVKQKSVEVTEEDLK